nr:hypothetical protein CFP56_34725 [Quercus suber]
MGALLRRVLGEVDVSDLLREEMCGWYIPYRNPGSGCGAMRSRATATRAGPTRDLLALRRPGQPAGEISGVEEPRRLAGGEMIVMVVRTGTGEAQIERNRASVTSAYVRSGEFGMSKAAGAMAAPVRVHGRRSSFLPFPHRLGHHHRLEPGRYTLN